MILQTRGVTKGMNSNISPLLHPSDQPEKLLGCRNDYIIGNITKDVGYSLVDAQILAGKSITGLFNFRQDASTQKMLATIDDSTSDDTQLFYKTSAGTWTEIGAAETAWANKAGINVEMESFLGYCFFVGWGATDGFLPVASLTGTTFSTATNVTSMPQAKYITRHLGQLFIANCYNAVNQPFRVYKSSFHSAGAITWTPATDFLDVDYSEEITGAVSAWRKYIAFTEYKTWMYDGASWDDPWEVGCVNHRTIKRSGPYLIWCSSDGVEVSTGGQPQIISGEIEKFYRAATPLSLFAELVNENYYLYLGNVIVAGISYSNLMAVFNIGKSIWWLRELGDTMTIFGKYNSSGKKRLYMGTSAGKVMDKCEYTDATLVSTDNGVAISSSFDLAPLVIDSLDKVKKLKAVVAFADRAQGLKLKYRIVDKNTKAVTPPRPLGELTQYINSFDVDCDDGVIIQICGAENGIRPYWSFMGYSLEVDVFGNILK